MFDEFCLILQKVGRRKDRNDEVKVAFRQIVCLRKSYFYDITISLAKLWVERRPWSNEHTFI
jgi:hypothetical protein